MITELSDPNLTLSEVESGKRRGPRPRTLAEVAAHIIRRSVPDGDCLIWTGAKVRGYGMVLARGVHPKPLYAHRVILAAAHGFPVTGAWAGGRESSHLCDRQKACVNLAHLVAEPHAANMDRIPESRRGRPTFFDTEAVAAEITRDGIWPVVIRHGMSYKHALSIRNGWRPKKSYCPPLATSETRVLCPEEAIA
jgi:hypothetical protein